MYVPVLGREEVSNLTSCVENNELIRGPFATQFERQIAGFVGAAHAVGTNSGTAALHVALMLSGVQAGEEVFITTLTFIAPANTIAYMGAHPIFVDVRDDDWQIDAARMERFIAERCDFDGQVLRNRETGRRITAVIVVHFFGMPADIDAIMALAARYNLKVIEDAAQALGTRIGTRRVGGIAPIGCFSFYGNKLITAGGGGMVVTGGEAMAARGRYLVNQAKDDPVETLHNEIGYNYRMTNLHGAIGCAQFGRIEQHIAAKRAISQRYLAGLAGLGGVELLREKPGTFCTYWLSSIRVDARRFGMTARDILARLRGLEIETLPVYQPLHRSKAHEGAQHCGGAVAERIAEEALSLPSSVDLSADDQDRVIDAIRSCAKAARRTA